MRRPPPPNPTLIIYGPGWTPTTIPIRTQGSLTILGLTIDISSTQSTQPHSTCATLTRAATLLGFQRVADTTALVASISTMAKGSLLYPSRKIYKRWMDPKTAPSGAFYNSLIPTPTLCSTSVQAASASLGSQTKSTSVNGL